MVPFRVPKGSLAYPAVPRRDSHNLLWITAITFSDNHFGLAAVEVS